MMLRVGKARRIVEILCNHFKFSVFVLAVEKDKRQAIPYVLLSQWFGAFPQKELAYHSFERIGRAYFPQGQFKPPLGYEHAGLSESPEAMVSVSGGTPELNQLLSCILLWALETSGTIHDVTIIHPSQLIWEKEVRKDQARYKTNGKAVSSSRIYIKVPDDNLPQKEYFIQHTVGELNEYALNLIDHDTVVLNQMISQQCCIKGDNIIVKCPDGTLLKVFLSEQWIS